MDIKAHLQDIYGVEVAPELISEATDNIMDDVIVWRINKKDSSEG